MLVKNKIKSNLCTPQLYIKDPYYNAPLASDKIEYHLSQFELQIQTTIKTFYHNGNNTS